MAFLGTAQPLQTTAFGDLDVAELTPKIQLQFPYNINFLEVITTATGGGTVSFLQPFAVCSTSAGATSSASLSSKRNLHYATGQGGVCLLTAIFTTGVSGSTQWAGLANTLDALQFGYNGVTFGINRRYNGIDNFVAQPSWNVDPMDGTGPSGMRLVPTTGNVYKIQYQWLGFGDIRFFLENPATGTFQLVHMIQYPNSATTTSLLNPSMQVNIQANNTSNTSNIVIKSPSMSAFQEGNVSLLGNNFSTTNSKSISSGTPLTVFNLRNNATFNSITNYKQMRITGISMANGNRIAQFYFVLNGSLTSTPAYVNISSTTSVASVDTTGTSVTGGQPIGTYYVGINSSATFDLTDQVIILEAGDVLSCIANPVSGGAVPLYVSINWIEQF